MSTLPRPELCVGAVVLHDDCLLMIRRGTPPGVGLWSLPGGRVEAGETLASALLREVEEETGLPCVCGALLGWVERISAEHHFVILDFLATPLQTDPVVAGDDASEARWVPLFEVGELALVAGLMEFLAEHDIIDTIV